MDPAIHNISSDGWINVRQITATLRRQSTSGSVTSDCSDCTPVVSSELRCGSVTVTSITAANTMPGIPLMIHAQRQPCKLHTSVQYILLFSRYDVSCLYLSLSSLNLFICAYVLVPSGARCNNNDPYVSIPLTLSSAPNNMQRYAPARALHSEQTGIFARLRAVNTTVA